MPTTELSPLANHLWQSTLCALVAWMLALLLRKNRAAVRYGIWLAASIKFLVPFSLLVSAGSHVRLPLVPTNPAQSFSSAVEEIERPFGLPDPTRRPTTRPVSYPGPGILFVIWLAGFAAVVWTWCRWWRRIRAIQREATPWPLNVAVPVMFAAGRLEPGIFGIWKPVLLLPEGINEHLRSDQFETVLAHELCHVRRRDNLTAAMHMVSEAVFWFYPLLWWIRARLIRSGSAPAMRKFCGRASTLKSMPRAS